MRFRSRRTEEPEINLIPLIDVLLMALIFLLVTTSFSKYSQLQLQLPEASADAKPEDAALRVSIDAKGQYFINDKQLINATPEVLRQAMLEGVNTKKDPVVIIQADRRTPHEAVVRVMDSARRLGLTHITFATQQQPADGSTP